MGLFDFLKKKDHIDIHVSQTPQSVIDAKNKAELDQLQIQKEQLSKKHDANLAGINLNDLVTTQQDDRLSELEIDFLAYLNKKKTHPLKIARSWTERGIDFQNSLRKFFSCGLMEISSERFVATDNGEMVIEAKKKRDLDKKFRSASLASHEHLRIGNLHAYRDDLMLIAEVYLEEKEYRSALETLMMVFVLDASGAPTPELIRVNQERIRDGWIKKGTLLEYHPLIIPYPLRLIDKAVNELNLSIEEADQVFRETITQEQIPLNFCTVDEFARLFLSAISGDGKANDLVKKYEKRFISAHAK